MSIRELRNKQVLITGAAAGIGRAAALAFAKRGANIIASDISAAALETVKGEIEALGVSCVTYAVDVSNEAAMKAFADFVHTKFGAVDVLINNAGIGYLGNFLQSDLAHWQRVLNINVMGVVHGCYFFMPKMIEAGGPRQVINVSSAAGIYPSATMAAYGASKGAVWSLSEVLKMEMVDTEVGITTVCPGIINTAITKSPGNISPSITEAQLAKLQAYYQAEGCSPDVVGEAMVRAVQRGEDMVLTGPFAKIINAARKISLWLVRRVMVDSARKIGFL